MISRMPGRRRFWGLRGQVALSALSVALRVVFTLTAALLGVAVSLPAIAADLTAPKQTERRMLGQSVDRPLKASVDPQVTENLAELRTKAQTQGKVRVIIGVRAAFAPEGYLSEAHARIQRDDIANVQRRIHARLPRQAANAVTHFEFIPFSALAVDADELDALAAMSEVTDIQEDRLSKPMLAESVPLIRANAAWAAGYTGNGWAVAVLDTGVDKTHPFLSGKIVSEACYSTSDFFGSLSSVCPGGALQSVAPGSGLNCSVNIDGCQHGTHVAGIAAGLGNTFSGVAKGANIITIQVFSRVDSVFSCWPDPSPCITATDQNIGQALEQVYRLSHTHNIAAVNMSLGGARFITQSACDANQSMVKATIDLLRSAGIATVIASGNDGSVDSTRWPGCISSATLVGATFDAAGYTNNGDGWFGGNSRADDVAYFSNSASFLDLLAPGADIVSSVPGPRFESEWGTSMAAPHVAGCWAILKQARPLATVDQIELALKTTGKPVTDWRTGLVKPRIDCKAALDSLLGNNSAPNLTISTFGVSPATVNVNGSLNLSATVRNAGTGSSAATTLRYYRWTGVWTEILSCADSIGPLAPAAISNQSCTIIAPSIAGTNYYYVAVDPVPGESDTTDNSIHYVSIEVTAAPIPTYLLTVTRAGTGSGTVTGTGINCGGDCTELFTSGTPVTLTATPTAGSTFTGWSGACVGAICQPNMTAAKSVTANFALSPPNLTISAFSASPPTVNVGDSVNLAATVRNAGAGSSGATTLRYFYWTGFAWNEIAFCRDAVGALASGATSNQSCAIVPPATPDFYYYYVAVDTVAGESNTSDNSASYVTVNVVLPTQGGTNELVLPAYYAPNLNFCKTVSFPGSSYVQVTTAGSLEPGYDFAMIYDGAGRLANQWSGDFGNFEGSSGTAVIAGSVVKMCFATDGDVNTSAGATLRALPWSSPMTSWTVHANYPGNEYDRNMLSVPGAAQIVVTLRGETESDYDFFRLWDTNNNFLGAFSGAMNYRWILPGPSVTFEFSSDSSVNSGVETILSVAPSGGSNVALASAGANATASSTYGPAYPATAVNDNNRAVGFWVDGTYGAFPDSVQINFNGTQTIDHVVVYSVQDDPAHPVEPTDTQTFSLYGITAFTVEGWNGSTWVTLGNVTGNNLVKRTVNFAAFTTGRIRINVNAAAQQYSAIAEIEAWSVSSPPPAGSNVALASAGANAAASSTYGPAYPATAVNDNNRAVGFWVDGTYGAFPDSVQINFNGTQTIDHVVVYSAQDDLAHPVEPTDTQTFALYGITAFTVEGWNGSTWVALGSVTGNNRVKRTVNFAAFTTDRIRINVNAAAQQYSAIAEIEAWSVLSPPPAGSNVALASAGANATASSTYGPAYPATAVNDNNRAVGFWVDGTYGAFPDSVQINFNGTQTIDHVVVYSVQDDLAHPVEPTDTQTFSLYGITAFTVEGWNGSTWVTLGSVTGNNLVKRTVNFAAFTTDRIRINANAAAQPYSAIAEIEAWGY